MVVRSTFEHFNKVFMNVYVPTTTGAVRVQFLQVLSSVLSKVNVFIFRRRF